MNEKFLLEKARHGLPEVITKKERRLLAKNMPFQKILGFVNFDDVRIELKHKVLIPQYETEEVLHKALSYINAQSHVLDLCCGSGYLGLSIAKKQRQKLWWVISIVPQLNKRAIMRVLII